MVALQNEALKCIRIKAIEDQKKSLGQMKHGGQVLDLDEGLIQELIAAGADIKIL
jgi:hypothetical protein